jgi:hypothetical protein
LRNGSREKNKEPPRSVITSLENKWLTQDMTFQKKAEPKVETDKEKVR